MLSKNEQQKAALTGGFCIGFTRTAAHAFPEGLSKSSASFLFAGFTRTPAHAFIQNPQELRSQVVWRVPAMALSMSVSGRFPRQLVIDTDHEHVVGIGLLGESHEEDDARTGWPLCSVIGLFEDTHRQEHLVVGGLDSVGELRRRCQRPWCLFLALKGKRSPDPSSI